jgi:hypothetical protein
MLDAEQLDFFQKKLKNMLFGYNMGEGREQRLEAYLFELQKRYKYLDIATVAAVIQNIPTHHRDFPPTAGQFGDALESLQTRKNKDAETAQILGRNPTADYQALNGNNLSTPALSGNAPKTAQDAPESEIPAWVADWVGGTVDYSQGRYREEYICEFVGFEKDLRRAVPMDVPSLWHKIATTKIMFAYNAGRTMGKVAEKRMIQGFEDSLADSGPAAQKMFASLVEAAQVS